MTLEGRIGHKLSASQARVAQRKSSAECALDIQTPPPLLDQEIRCKRIALLPILIATCRDAGSNLRGHGEVTVLLISTGEPIFESKRGITESIMELWVVMDQIRRGSKRELKFSKWDELYSSRPTCGHKRVSTGQKLPGNVVDGSFLQVGGSGDQWSYPMRLAGASNGRSIEP